MFITKFLIIYIFLNIIFKIWLTKLKILLISSVSVSPVEIGPTVPEITWNKQADRNWKKYILVNVPSIHTYALSKKRLFYYYKQIL